MILLGGELFKLGDTADLECVIDVLSTDAVTISRRAKIYLEHCGGDRPLLGRVRLVELAAFTKVSALGVEEQA
jgi:HlyD family secretion protein